MGSSYSLMLSLSYIAGICTLVFCSVWIYGSKSKNTKLESEVFYYFLFSFAGFVIFTTLYLYMSGQLQAWLDSLNQH